MQLFGKPKNQWGWVRWGGWAFLAWRLVLMAWAFASRKIDLLNGIEMLLIPLILIPLGTWREHEQVKHELEHAAHLEAEQAEAARHSETVQRVREAVLAELGAPQAEGGMLAKAGEIVRRDLPGLNPKGKGELLHFLFGRGLLSGETALELKGADFGGVKLEKAALEGVRLEGVDLSKARMDGCQLQGARLDGSNLRHAFLRHAGLGAASLAGADLTRAHLDGADLAGADLQGAVLKNAHLVRVTLEGAKVSGEALEQAIIIDAVMPDGARVTNERGREYLRSKELEQVVARL